MIRAVIIATAFQWLPDKVDISIIPTLSGAAVVLAGTLAIVFDPSRLADVTVRSGVIGGVVGATIFGLGVGHVAFR